MAGSASTFLFIVLFVSLGFLFPTCLMEALPVKVVDIKKSPVEFTPSPLYQYPSSHNSKDTLFCERVQVRGKSRLNLGSFASSFRVTLVPSVMIPERLHDKIYVCFHSNASLGLCQCEEWKAVQKGTWSSATSPYMDRYVDVKSVRELPGPVTLTIDEEFHQWRLYCLALGFAVLLLAPIVSSWVPFYYSSSMVIGVVLVILILLFQGMKLLPGRKNFFYFLMSGPLLGVGSLFMYYFSMLVKSVVINFGMSEEMHHLVSIFVLIGLVLAGAGLGYWMVRKFIISEDGTVEIGVAQFVKWAMRFIAATLFSQSSFDTPLAAVAFFSCWAVCFLILKWQDIMDAFDECPWFWKASRLGRLNCNRAEFYSRRLGIGDQRTVRKSPKATYAWSNSPVEGVVSPSLSQTDFYSTFHKTPKRRKVSKKEWEESKMELTRKAIGDLAASPEFVGWMIENADKIKFHPGDESSDRTVESASDSTEENDAESGNRLSGFWRW